MQNLTQPLQRVYALLSGGDAAAARSAIGPLLQAGPDHPGVLHLAALIERRGGNLPGAREYLTRIVAAGAATAEIRNTLGNVLTELQDFLAAEAQYAAANAQEPTYAPAWTGRGQLATQRGEFRAAIAHLKRAAALQPGSALIQTSLAEAHRKSGDYVGAERAARRAIELAPDKANPRLALGLALRAADRPSDAVSEYRAAVAAGINSPELLEALGGAFLEGGDTADALNAYDRLTAEFPTYLRGHRERARLHFEAALPGDPFASFRHLSELYPREPAVWQEWLNALVNYRQFGEAVEVASRAERSVGASPAWGRVQAVALTAQGELSKAGALYQEIAAAYEADWTFHENVALHALRSKEPDQAASAAQAALALDPDAQSAWAVLGTAWRLLDDPREHWLCDYEHYAALLNAAPLDEDPLAFAQAAAPALRRLHITKAHPPDQTLRGGTQTPGALFDRNEPVVRAIEAAVRLTVRTFVATLPDDRTHPFLRRKDPEIRFAGSWSVRLTTQGFHVNHVHSQGWLSSAFYFALPDSTDHGAEHEGWLQLGQPPAELGLDLEPRRLIQPRVGSLALFPSYMWHGTVPFSTTGERLTCAFDMLPLA